MYVGELCQNSTDLVDFGLIFELWVFGLYRLKFDGYFLAGDDVDAKVNITCE